MPNVIKIKIDCTLIDKARLFAGKKKNKKDKLPQYLDAVLLPSKPTNFGDSRDEQTHMIVQSVTKEERDKGIQGDIIGNAKELTGRDRRPSASESPAESPAEQPTESDDVPF